MNLAEHWRRNWECLKEVDFISIVVRVLIFLSFSPALFNHCFKIEVSTGKNFLFSVWSIVYSLIIFELLHLTSL